MSTPSTATEILKKERSHRIVPAMNRLLYELRRWTRAVPMNHDDEMPEHDIVFETEFENGPEKAVHDAIKCNPALWEHAIPSEVVMVPRVALEKAGLDRKMIECLANMGANAVANQAARHLYEAEERRSK